MTVESTNHNKLLYLPQNPEETGVHVEKEAPGSGDSAVSRPSVLCKFMFNALLKIHLHAKLDRFTSS